MASWFVFSGGNAGDGGVICSGNGSILCGFPAGAVKKRERELVATCIVVVQSV